MKIFLYTKYSLYEDIVILREIKDNYVYYVSFYFISGIYEKPENWPVQNVIVLKLPRENQTINMNRCLKSE